MDGCLHPVPEKESAIFEAEVGIGLVFVKQFVCKIEVIQPWQI